MATSLVSSITFFFVFVLPAHKNGNQASCDPQVAFFSSPGSSIVSTSTTCSTWEGVHFWYFCGKEIDTKVIKTNVYEKTQPQQQQQQIHKISKSLPAVKPPFKPPSRSDHRKDALAKLNHRCGAVVKGIASPSSAGKPLELRPIEETAVAKFNLAMLWLQSFSIEGGWLVGVGRWEMRNEWEWGVRLKAYMYCICMNMCAWHDRIRCDMMW